MAENDCVAPRLLIGRWEIDFSTVPARQRSFGGLLRIGSAPTVELGTAIGGLIGGFIGSAITGGIAGTGGR